MTQNKKRQTRVVKDDLPRKKRAARKNHHALSSSPPKIVVIDDEDVNDDASPLVILIDSDSDSDHPIPATGPVSKRHGYWSNINSDILEYIQKKLPLLDILRCRSVCRPWRSTTKAHLLSSLKNPSPPPMIMLYWKFANFFGEEDYSGSSGDHLFLNLAAAPKMGERSQRIEVNKSVYNKHLPIGQLSHGWLVSQNLRDGRICMFNPSTFGPVTCLRLPLIPLPLRSGLRKVVFWGNPVLDSNKNYGFVMICGDPNNRRLQFAKCGDTKLSELEGQFYRGGVGVDLIRDIISINNRVYGVTSDGYVEVWDCTSTSTSPPKKILGFQPHLPTRDSYISFYNVCLVESQGEILLVTYNYIRGGRHKLDPKNYFGVYKLDLYLKRWVVVDSLGDRVLLLLYSTQPRLLSTKEFPNYKSNSIYFVHRDIIHILNLEDGSLKAADTGTLLSLLE